MDERDTLPSSSENGTLSAKGEQQSLRAEAPPRQEISWRRNIVGVLIAGVSFSILLALSGAIPELVWLSCIVFLVVGLWIGWESPRPWVDGAMYGLLASLATVLVLFVSGYQLGALVLIYPLFLALPQGIFGAWLGARLAQLIR